MRVTHHFGADVETVFRLMSDPDFMTRKYEAIGAADVAIDAEGRGGSLHRTTKRKVTVDLPGFAKKVMQPTNTVIQDDDWAEATADGRRVCTYSVEVQGVPSRIDGTVTLSPDGDGTRQDVVAEVKVSIPLLGGRLEKFAVESGVKTLQDEADFTAAALAG